MWSKRVVVWSLEGCASEHTFLLTELLVVWLVFAAVSVACCLFCFIAVSTPTTPLKRCQPLPHLCGSINSYHTFEAASTPAEYLYWLSNFSPCFKGPGCWRLGWLPCGLKCRFFFPFCCCCCCCCTGLFCLGCLWGALGFAGAGFLLSAAGARLEATALLRCLLGVFCLGCLWDAVGFAGAGLFLSAAGARLEATALLGWLLGVICLGCLWGALGFAGAGFFLSAAGARLEATAFNLLGWLLGALCLGCLWGAEGYAEVGSIMCAERPVSCMCKWLKQACCAEGCRDFYFTTQEVSLLGITCLDCVVR